MYKLTFETLAFQPSYVRARLEKDEKILQESAYLVNPVDDKNVEEELLKVAGKFLAGKADQTKRRTGK